jgi:GNAT superfamily N-acetyltransferase
MFATLPVRWSEHAERFCSVPGFSLDPATARRAAPEAMWLLQDGAGRAVARCSLWWKRTPRLDGMKIGYVGHYAVICPEASGQILDLACSELRQHGCLKAVGPIDGSTWQRYRLVTDLGTEPPFFMEPTNPEEWPGYFISAGFTPLAEYVSALNPNLAVNDPRLPGLAQEIDDRGISIRTMDESLFSEELRRVYALSLSSFRQNFLYTPINQDDFIAQYEAVRRYLHPGLILFAESENELVGFCFAIPDLLQAQRGDPTDTVILKTLAVRPDFGGFGLGTLLLARAQEVARQEGFRRAIHALMHETNPSGKISSHTANIFRRYTLYARDLC